MSTIEAVEPQTHEVALNYIFADDGLNPYFACFQSIKTGGGSRTGAFKLDGEQWKATLYYQESGICHPGDETPQGTPIAIDEIREYRLAIERSSDEDPIEKQRLNAHLSPRWQGMEVENSYGERSELSIPTGISEAVNVRVQGSNVDVFRYQDLVARAFQSVDISAGYFEDPHEYSNVQDLARYVRVDDDRSGPVHARDGPIANLGHLLESDRTGYRKVVQNDCDEDGETVPGYYHTVTLGPERVTEAFPGHRAPREIKHYKSREYKSLESSHPIKNPKVEVSYQASRWDESVGVDPESLRDLVRQLDETLLAVLADAGINVHPQDGSGGGGPFVEDRYFDPSRSIERELVELNLTEIQSHQESVVIRHLADGGFSPVEWEALEYLVTDGGEVAPKDIAAAEGRHEDSVRRALNRIPELVESEYGRVSLRSNHIAELVHNAVQEAKDATRRAVEAGAKAVAAADRGLDETTSALMAWCAKHGVDVDDRADARLKIRLGDVASTHDARRRLSEAYRLWCDAGKDPVRFRQAQVEVNGGLAAARRYLDANRGRARYVQHR
ncbi:hypothetical protein Halru_2052 [Halovivax ruber XH-70]|uniref:DUF7845 domain-containing protein n=1 Tax=Halovivax ruber (strain DSM 18193 / JCM 13892 / XH-70) TaxID=797302 RepID=L0IEJ3_HALRX|nr:hypothetical protein [Halovivax ruber]AGB16646.1 hypothetical protein Halru_2052 [Halovivax ruber XH-70]